MNTQEFTERFQSGDRVSIGEPSRTHWIEMGVLFVGAFLTITGIWPWWVAGEPTPWIAFFAAVCAFGLGVFSYETFHHYNSVHGFVKDPEMGVQLIEAGGDVDVH